MVEPAPVVIEAPAPVEEPAPASALTANGRAPNDPREVRRRKREAERLQKEAEQAAAQAPAAEPAPVEEEVAEAAPAPVAETPTESAPAFDEPQQTAEEVAPRHTEALEKEHEPKPHA
ncbi:hypothetical protein D3C84_984910 [compost metagenome]